MTFAPSRAGANPARQPTPSAALPDGTGLDVGSTTVKVVVASGGIVIHRAYERHRGQAAACVDAMLANARAHAFRAERIVMTGSLGAALANERGIPHVHEVHAVAQAVRAQFPRTRTVVELGGQDAKLILLEEGIEPRISTEMNDRCAAGTGATLDRCLSRIGFDGSALSRFELPAGDLPDVSARCGVFAESDLVTLVKSGVPTERAVGGLLAALVRGNLAALGKAHALVPPVILLGGPHAFVPALAVLWSRFLTQRWVRHGVPTYGEGSVTVPDSALYMAAEGALRLAAVVERRRWGSGVTRREPARPARFSSGAAERMGRKVCAGLLMSSNELPRQASSTSLSRETDRGDRLWLGIDAGSTTIKAVVLGDEGAVRATLYRRAERNPLEDGQALLAELARELGGETRRIEGLGMTGYAADVLGPVFGADAAPVETVAHAESAHHFFPDADVVCDIGGQDVKILLLEHGAVKNFHLSNQCAAGNGVLLEAVARELGIPLAEYAKIAFSADRAPRLNVGCAVFLDTERVSLERDGFTRAEILAGFAAVLPRNVWENVVAAPNLATLGRVFVLSGGVQRNLAAVKAQVDYILERHPDAAIHVHPHPAEAGAIGAALAARAARRGSPKRFRGIDSLLAMTFSSRSDRTTQCAICPNHCRRTVVNAVTRERHALTLVTGHACERGSGPPGPSRHRATVPWARNLLRTECARLFEQQVQVDVVSDAGNGVRVVMPRALAMYRSAPFFRHYFEAIGVARDAISMSPETDDVQRLVQREGRGPDACFPAKLAQAHVAAVLAAGRLSRFDVLFFPILTHAKTNVRGCRDSMACPLVAGAPLVSRAIFGQGGDALPNGTRLSMPVLNLTEPELLAEQLHRAVRGFVPKLSPREHLAALNEARRAQAHIERQLELDGIRLIARSRQERRAAVVLLGRPYHVDPGIHHDIGSELRALGRSTLSLRALPRARPEVLEGPDRCSDFAAFWDVGREGQALTNSGAAEKLAAARLVGCEPYLVAIEFSSFKCGQDAALYASISRHARGAGKPFLALHDMDETRPVASLRLRLRTFLHGVEAYEQALRLHAS